MNRDAQRLIDYLAHVREAVERIQGYVEPLDLPEFLSNPMAQDAVIRNLEIIGEACHNILDRYPQFATDHPELPLASAYQMRNAVSHGYFKVDLEVVWRTIASDLPPLYQQVCGLLEKLRTGSAR